MSHALKPYPAMKDSGVPWLGQVPEHWEIRRLGALLQERRETNEDLGVMDVLSVLRDRGVIPYAEKGNIGNKKSDDITRYKIVRPNDIVVNCMNVIIGSVGLSQYTGCLSPVYYVLTRRADADDPRYLNAYFQTKPFQRSLVRIGNGILAHRMRIPMELLKSEPFPRPPSPEQAAIVRYLDHADRKVRRAIRARQQLIKLLTEQKQAIIQRAVTRGLDPNVRLKPSGVSWLGDVPEHWAISRVKDEFNCLDRRRIPLSGVERGAMSSQQYDYYGASGIIDKVADFLFDDELLLIAEDGANLVLRNLPLAIIARGKFWVNNHAHILKPKQGNIEYLSAVMEMLNYQPWISGAAQPKLTQDRLMSIALAIPPRDEQDQIIANVQEKTASLCHAIDAARREIDLLREYRTRLIADVVTGKLDVRDVPVPADETDVLPEELENIDDVEATDESDDVAETDPSSEESA